MNYTILCKPRRDARVVEWAGLEIRSLSQDRGFESLSLLETKSGAVRPRFLFHRAVVRTLEEGSTKSAENEVNKADFGITAKGRNLEGNKRM